MKKRKLVALGLAVSMMAGLLSGCGSGKEVSSNQEEGVSSAVSADGAVTESKPAESGEKMSISVMGVDWGFGPLADSEMEQHWEEMFDVDLNIEWVNNQDYSQKLNTLIAAGSQPDVTQIYKVNNSFYYPIFTQAIDAGQFVDMKPYLFEGDNALANTNAVMKNWKQDFWDEATYNEGIYILPRSKTEQAAQSGLMVRKDLMEKYGFEKEPATMDELKDWLIGLSNAATEGEGQKIYALEWFGDDFMHDRIKAFAIAFTGQMDWTIDENGEYSYMQFNDKYIDFLNWMKDLYDADVLDSEFALNNSDTSKFKAGNSILYLNAWYNFNQSADKTSTKIFDKSTPDTYTAWALMPVKGPEAYTISPNALNIDSCIAISASCSEEKIQKILQVFNATDEEYPGYDLLMSDGVEGIHYKQLEDGTRDTTDEVMGQKRTEGYVGGWNQIFLKVDPDQITSKFMRGGAKRASDENIARVTEIKKFIEEDIKKSGIKNVILNLQSDTYNKQWSILTDDVNTMCTQYVMGQIGETEWKSFVEDLRNSADYKAIQQEFKEASGS